MNRLPPYSPIVLRKMDTVDTSTATDTADDSTDFMYGSIMAQLSFWGDLLDAKGVDELHAVTIDGAKKLAKYGKDLVAEIEKYEHSVHNQKSVLSASCPAYNTKASGVHLSQFTTPLTRLDEIGGWDSMAQSNLVDGNSAPPQLDNSSSPVASPVAKESEKDLPSSLSSTPYGDSSLATPFNSTAFHDSPTDGHVQEEDSSHASTPSYATPLPTGKSVGWDSTAQSNLGVRMVQSFSVLYS